MQENENLEAPEMFPEEAPEVTETLNSSQVISYT